MTQYLLSVHNDGDEPLRHRRGDAAGVPRHRRGQRGDAGRRASGSSPAASSRRARRAVVRAARRRARAHRRPVRREQGAHRRLLDHRRARPRRPRWRGPTEATRRLPGRRRGAAVPGRVRRLHRDDDGSRHRRRDRARLPRGVRARGGGPGPRLSATSTSPRRRCRTRSPRRCARWPARRRAAEPGRLDHHDRAQPGDRPAAPRGDRATTATRRPRCCTPRTSPSEDGCRARRPAAPDLHLLPPGARAGARRSR